MADKKKAGLRERHIAGRVSSDAKSARRGGSSHSGRDVSDKSLRVMRETSVTYGKALKRLADK